MKLLARLRPRLSYANVIATLALFLVLGGGAAFAATQLPKNSVGAKQLRKQAVTPSKLAKSTLKQLQGATGPAGAVGPAGPKGDSGAAGQDAGPVYSAVLEGPGIEFPTGEESAVEALTLKNLPAGSYSVSFTGSFLSTSEEVFQLLCGIGTEGVETTQGGEGIALTSLQGGNGDDPEVGSVAAQTVVTFPSAGGELTAGCDVTGAEVEELEDPTIFATDLVLIAPQLTALKVPSAAIEEIAGGPVPTSNAATLRALGLNH